MTRFLWNIFCFLLWSTQLIRLFRHSKRTKGIILCYGGITETGKTKQPWNGDGRYIDKRKLERQISYLRRHYDIVYPSKIAAAVEKDRAVPEKSAALTFDYGYMAAYTNVFKRLIENSIPFGFSLVTGLVQNHELIWYDRLELAISKARSRAVRVKVGGSFIDEKTATPRQKARAYLLLKGVGAVLDVQKREMFLTEIENQAQHTVKDDSDIPDDCAGMTAQEISEVAAGGAEAGSQSAHLVDLMHIARRHLLEEIYESRHQVSRLTGTDCSYFVYPMWTEGTPDEALVELVEKSGYSFALTNVPAFVEGSSNPYSLPRITITGYENFFTFAAKLAGIGLKRNLIR